jgi:NAD(P)-dependent dehydrogenase (short-subunit alcohol dehydrogenase family)
MKCVREEGLTTDGLKNDSG